MEAADGDRPLVSAALDKALRRLLEEYGAPLLPELHAAGMRSYDAYVAANQKGGPDSAQRRSMRLALGLPDDTEDDAVVEAGASELIRELERLGRGIQPVGAGPHATGPGSGGLLGARFTLRNVKDKLRTLCAGFDEASIDRTWKDALAFVPRAEPLPVPFLPTVGSGKAPADFGNLVHRHYQERYRESFAMRRLVIERTQFLATDEVGTAAGPRTTLAGHARDVPYTEYRVLHELLQSPAGYPARADLVDLTSREAWEIKPVKGIPEAVAQIAHLTLGFGCLARTHQLKPDEATLKPGGMWPPGLTTPFVYVDPATPRYVSMAMPLSADLYPGLFLYEVARLDAAKVAVGITVLDRLKKLWEDRAAKRKQAGEGGVKGTDTGTADGAGGLATSRTSSGWASTLHAVPWAAVVLIVGFGAVQLFITPPPLKLAIAAAIFLIPSPAGAGVPHALKPLGPAVKDAVTRATTHPVALGGRLYHVPDVPAFANLVWSQMGGWLQAALDDKQAEIPALDR